MIGRAANILASGQVSVGEAALAMVAGGAHPCEAALAARAGLLLLDGWEEVPASGGPLRSSEGWAGEVRGGAKNG